MKILSDNTYAAIMDRLIELENENKELRIKLDGVEKLLDVNADIIADLMKQIRLYQTVEYSDFKFGD